jgi:hypothetical protein
MTMTTVAATNREMGFIDATGDRNTRRSFGKARKLQPEMEDWFARRTFVRAIDIGVFAEVALASLRGDKPGTHEF